MPYIYIPTKSADDWQQFLGDPDKHWRSGYSARAAAHSWQDADGFPLELDNLFGSAEDNNLHGAELLFAIPEHKVYFPPMRRRPSQNDVFALGKAANGELISIAVEAKVSESFNEPVDEWAADASPGKEERLAFLVSKLRLEKRVIGHIRYQLLHRLVSALLEAERFNANYAVLVVHSFSQSDKWFDDFAEFISLYDQAAVVGKLVQLDLDAKFKVFAGWAKGAAKYLAV